MIRMKNTATVDQDVVNEVATVIWEWVWFAQLCALVDVFARKIIIAMKLTNGTHAQYRQDASRKRNAQSVREMRHQGLEIQCVRKPAAQSTTNAEFSF